MRTLKLAVAAVAAFALNANAQVTGTGGSYQPAITGAAVDGAGFHAGGVAACDGCHVMHNASGGAAKSSTSRGDAVAAWSNVANMYLLQGSDQSSTCLICHGAEKSANLQFSVADMTNSSAPSNRTPGGDFGWVRSTFSFTNSPSQRHGHNIAAADFGLEVDHDLAVAPGGTWASGTGKKQFACSSCHDPHGRYRMQQNAAKPYGVEFTGPFAGSSATLPIAASGSYGAEPTGAYAVGSYRLLAGQAYSPASNPSFPFPNDPPIAVSPTTYNQGEATSEVRVAYGTGMSEWCQNCHTNIHLDGYTSGVAGLRHPAGSDALLHAGQYEVYNRYVASGVMTASSAYTSLVPFEQGTDVSNLAGLKARTTAASILAGPKSAVMCLSCHRAHASAFDSMVRWDQNATFLTDASAYTPGLTNRTAAQTAAGYYDRTVGQGGTSLGSYQRSLCNKCHGKD
jgi:predicted CXXCH cytochrome family protein